MVRVIAAAAAVALPLAAGLRKSQHRSQGIACEMETDCNVNAWCQDTSFEEWCRSNGLQGSCPAPQCRLAGGPAPTPPAPTPPAPTPPAPTPPAPPPTPAPPTGPLLDAVLGVLQSSNHVFGTVMGRPSAIYQWADMTTAVREMASRGVGSARLWIGEGGSDPTYGLVNIAAFLAQCMKETIQYDACDENNWSDKDTVLVAGGTVYAATSACGQLKQSYQNYECTAEENELAGGQMACDVDPNMEFRAKTRADWYGAPAQMFCAPKSKVPQAPRWNYDPWCAPSGGWGHVEPFPDDVDLDTYFSYVNSGGICKDYAGQKAGGWEFCNGQGCPNPAAPLFGQPDGRTDLEGCCWWGRGVIQTTGVCNFGKLNYYLGKRAAAEGRDALFPQIDFCTNPNSICEEGGPPELKWIAGFFYWLNAVQTYSTMPGDYGDAAAYNYIDELKAFVDGGMSTGDVRFINGASGIVNRGCHNPPNCGTGVLDGERDRQTNFRTMLSAMGL